MYDEDILDIWHQVRDLRLIANHRKILAVCVCVSIFKFFDNGVLAYILMYSLTWTEYMQVTQYVKQMIPNQRRNEVLKHLGQDCETDYKLFKICKEWK